MKKLLWIGFAIVLVGVILYSNIHQQDIQADGKRTIYAILPLTGTMASVGKEIKKTITTYTSANPNIHFSVKFYDNFSDPNQTIHIARQISLNDKNPVFMCGVSGLCRPLIPVLKSINGFLLLSPSPRAETEDSKEYQRISYSHLDMNLPFINFVKSNQKVVIIHSNDETGNTGASLIEKRLADKQVKVLGKVSFEHQNLDNRIIVMKAISFNPDSIIITAGPSMGFIKIIKSLKEQDYKGNILADPSLRTPELIALFKGSEANGIYVPIMPTERIYNEYPQVVETMTKAGLELYNLTIDAWDTMDIVEYFETNKLPYTQEEFLKLQKWHGISSDIIFSEKGNSNYLFVMSKLENNQFIAEGE